MLLVTTSPRPVPDFYTHLLPVQNLLNPDNTKKVVIVGADKMSSIIDYTDRTTCVLFGDGAGAVLLEPNTEGYGVLDSILRSDGAGRAFLHQKAGGSVKPPTHTKQLMPANIMYFRMDSRSSKLLLQAWPMFPLEIMEKNNLHSEDVAWLVPHQANKRIIDANR